MSKWEHRVWNALFLTLMLLGVLKLERVIEATNALIPLWQSTPTAGPGLPDRPSVPAGTGKVVEEK